MTTDWQTIRVFISSTFRDMHAERDYLVKRVFPALRERLDKYRIHLVDIDLRWGITEEQADSDQALDLCLQQIDECRPFFIGLLGERYGFIPKRLPAEAISRYGWIQHHTGKSITELEMVHGVLQNPKMRPCTYFYFRDPVFIADVHETKRGDMEAEDAESAEKLRQLKTAIGEANLPVPPMENYPCEYAGLRINRRLVRRELSVEEIETLGDILEDGIVDPQEYNALNEHLRTVVDRQGTVHLKGLEAFGRQVSEHLWQGIKDRFDLPDTPPTEDRAKADLLAEEQDYHERFIEQRLRVHVTRKAVQAQLKEYAEGDATTPLLVTGPSGCGKSATLARFARDWAESHPGQVIPHFVGASPGSTNLNRMLSRFCGILKQRFGFEEDIPFETNDLSSLFREFTDKVPEDQPVLFVIDALNQLAEADYAHTLHWLPRELPGPVKMITSCIDDPEPAAKVLESFEHRSHESLTIDPLTDAEQRQIIHDVPSLSAKALDERQVELLLENSATRNPLFLLVVLEELRGFGSYEQLNDRIKHLPSEGDTITALFQQVIDRLEEEFDHVVVREVLCFLACSRYGLSHHELLDLTEGIGTVSSYTDLYPILRQLRPYTQSRGELIDFHHVNLKKAIQVRMGYLAELSDTQLFHRTIAEYFNKKLNPHEQTDWSGDCPRGLSELPYHLVSGAKSSGCWEFVSKLLVDFLFMDAKQRQLGIQSLLNDNKLVQDMTGGVLGLSGEAHEGLKVLRLVDWALRLSVHALNHDRDPLASQLTGRLIEFKFPAVQMLLEQIRRVHHMPWLRPVTPNLASPGGPLLRVLAGHSDDIEDIVITPDCRQVISGSRDNTLRVWDLETGIPLHILGGQKKRMTMEGIKSLAITPDGRCVISGAGDHTLRVWDLETGVSLRMFKGHTKEVAVVSITPDGQRLVSGSWDNTLRVWDMESGEILCRLEGHSDAIRAVVITPNGRNVISGSKDATLRLWDMTTGVCLCVFEGHTGEVTAVITTPDGRQIVSGSVDATLRIWDLETGELQKTLEGHKGCISAVAITPDGRRLITGSWWDTMLRIWDLAAGDFLQALEGHKGRISAIAITPDGRRAISGSEDHMLCVWNLEAYEIMQKLEGHWDVIKKIVITPDGRQVISGSRDAKLCLWDLEIEKPRRTSEKHSEGIKVIAITPDGKRVISGARDHSIRVWDLETGVTLNGLEGHSGSVTAMVVTPDCRHVISGAMNHTLRVRDLETGEILDVIEEHSGLLTAITVTPDCRHVISAYENATLRVWDLETGVTLHTLEGHGLWVTALAVTPDGRRVISGSADATQRVWDLESGESLFSLEGCSGSVFAIAVTPDGKHVVSGFWNNTLCVWDLETGEALHMLKGHSRQIEAIAINTDGRYIASASLDTTLRVWDIVSGDFVACFRGDSAITACAVGFNGRGLVAGDETGRVHFLRMENVCIN